MMCVKTWQVKMRMIRISRYKNHIFKLVWQKRDILITVCIINTDTNRKMGKEQKKELIYEENKQIINEGKQMV